MKEKFQPPCVCLNELYNPRCLPVYVNEALPSKATRARKFFTAYTLKLIVPHLLALRMIKLLVTYIQLYPLFLEITSTGVLKIQS